MKTAFQHSALLSTVALAVVPMFAFADDKPSALFEITLDIDNDGKTDRAVLVLVGSDRTDVGPLTDELYADISLALMPPISELRTRRWVTGIVGAVREVVLERAALVPGL